MAIPFVIDNAHHRLSDASKNLDDQSVGVSGETP
jgi:hypothetical protein